MHVACTSRALAGAGNKYLLEFIVAWERARATEKSMLFESGISVDLLARLRFSLFSFHRVFGVAVAKERERERERENNNNSNNNNNNNNNKEVTDWKIEMGARCGSHRD